MNGKDIFLGLKYVGDDLIEKAEYGQFPTKAEDTATQKKRLSIRKPFLIAAIIALTLLLVGCAVVYVLSMQDVKIGEATATRDYRLVDGTYVEDPHEVNENILTLAGLEGSNAYKACADYYTFKEEYTKNMEDMMNKGTLPEGFFENNTYGKAMEAKAAELAEQYGLKQEGETLDFRTTRNMCDALGVERFLRESEDISADITGGSCYENGNFYLYFRFNFPEDQGYEVLSTSGYLRWNRADSFSTDYVSLIDSGDWVERNYTTSSGSNLLILQSPTQERGYIICDRGDALMSLQLDVNIELLSEEGGVVSAEYQHMTDKQIELVADAVDFAVQPKVPTQEDVENQTAISQSTTQNGWTIGIKSVETDGYVAQIILSIAAPEGTVLPNEGNIIFANHGGELIPLDGTSNGGGGTTGYIDDSDGLENTMDLLLERDCTMADDSIPYAAGTTWNLHIVDIIYSDWDEANSRLIENTLAEGEWLFSITFDETNGDYREIELVSEPFQATACYGWGMDGTDALEEFTVTSFKLRKFSTDITWDLIPDYHGIKNFGESADFYAYNDQSGHHSAYVMMKDGTEIDLPLYRDSIDLNQVEYVMLADGTMLPMPGVDVQTVKAATVQVPELEGIELLSAPIEYRSLAGYAEGADGVREPLYETLPITSILLDSTGVTLPGSPWLDSADFQIQLVMKDGSKITLTGAGEGPYETPMSRLTTTKTIDVAQVDHLVLPDGVEVPVPDIP